jgi:hypothetical protein
MAEGTESLISRLRAYAGGRTVASDRAGPTSDALRGTQSPFDASNQNPLENAMGTTPPQPEPGTIRPTMAPPYGASGRANFYGLPQPDELNTLLLGQTGLRTFDTMYRTDADIRRLVLMAWSPIQAATWSLDPFGEDDATDADRQVADCIWWMLTHFMSPTLMEHISTVGPILLRSGFAPFEQIWKPCSHEGKTLLAPKKLDVRLPRTVWRWWQDQYGELTHLGQILPNRPDVVIPMSEVVYYRLAPEGDNWVGTSLLRHAYKAWYIKDKLERIDMVGQERKAVGVPLCYPPRNASDEQRRQMESLLASVHLNDVGYMMAPGPKAGLSDTQEGEGWFMDVIRFDSSSGDSIKESLRYHKEAIASSFLGDFMALGHHQVGARATAEVQEDPFLTAVEGMATYAVLPPLQRLIDRICELNFPTVEGSPRIRMQITDTASLSEIATYVQQLVMSEALQPDPELEDWLRERADLPPANADVREEKEEARKAGMEAAQKAMQEGPSTGEQERGEGPGGAPEKTPPGKTGKEEPPKAKAGKARSLESAPPPPHLRGAKQGSNERCATCKMFWHGGARGGQCWGYANYPVRRNQVCDSYSPALVKQLDDGQTAKWWESLLSQGKIAKGYESVRNTVQRDVEPAVLVMARQLAFQRSQDPGHESQPNTDEIRAGLRRHFNGLYDLGRATVKNELAKQRRRLRTLDDGVSGPDEQRRIRTKLRAQHSADLIGQATNAALTKAAIAGVAVSSLQQIAEQAATRELHAEAMEGSPQSIADGRTDVATSDPNVVGGYYTAVMDANTCEVCDEADTSQMLTVEEAEGQAPNPNCEGGGRCRCMIVWVLSNDPAALGIVAGE